MEEATRRVSVRAVLAVAAVVAVAAFIWAASALAAGGSNGDGGSGARDSPPVANAQSDGDERDRDCPNRGGESRTGSDI